MIKKYFLKRNYIENIFLSFNKSIALILLLIFMSLLLSSCTYESIEEKKEMQNDMTDFLQEKYDKEFVVDRPEGSSSTLSSLVTYTATAYPKDNPKVEFKIVTDFPEAKIYHENYLNKLWAYQGEPDVSSYLENMYGEKLPLIVSIKGSEELSKKLDYYEILDNHGSKIKYNIIYCVFVNEDFDKKIQAKKAFDVFNNYIRKNEVERYYFSVYYIKEVYKTEFFELFNKAKTEKYVAISSNKFMEEGKLENSLHISSMKFNVKKIKNPNFLKGLFKY